MMCNCDIQTPQGDFQGMQTQTSEHMVVFT